MATVSVHERVHIRHPELSDTDVLTAWQRTIAHGFRVKPDGVDIIAVGFDASGRFIEMVAAHDLATGSCLIFHAMTPPSKKTLKELRLEGRR